MFFELSKIFWFIASPSSLLALLLLGAAFGQFTRWRRTAKTCAIAAALIFSSVTFFPVGLMLLWPLENRFAPPTGLMTPDGIVVLGGGMDEVISAERDLSQLADGGNRMTQAVLLARRYPQARLVFSGRSGRLFPGAQTEADAARRFFVEEGLSPERLTFEDRSRNTWENAVYTQELVKPKSGERWLLVTSAFHMPRSMGIFRRVGFEVIPWPADYNTRPSMPRFSPGMESGRGLMLVDRALREYVGLVAYYLTDKTSALFPAP